MSDKGFCKGCLESVIVSEEVIQQLVLEAEEDPSQIVSDEIYEYRLMHCNSCRFLQYETTCSHSGCIVRYRAKFKNKGCPNIEKTRWDKVI
jgi:Rieske Fe-S protein